MPSDLSIYRKNAPQKTNNILLAVRYYIAPEAFSQIKNRWTHTNIPKKTLLLRAKYSYQLVFLNKKKSSAMKSLHENMIIKQLLAFINLISRK